MGASFDAARLGLTRIVVAVDPAVTSGEDSDETGIIVVGRGPHRGSTCQLADICPGHGYVLDDLTCKAIPAHLARIIVRAFDYYEANKVVAEVNNGGDWIGTAVKAVRRDVPYEAVRATRGKLTRAEPASALYEQGRVHHLQPLSKLEDELLTWTPTQGKSPDRLDALVWGLTALRLIGTNQGLSEISDEEWQERQTLMAALFSDAPPVIYAKPGMFYAGDTSMRAAGIIDDDFDPDAKPRPNGKVVRSPFA